MCAKCECKKSFTWLDRDTQWHLISPEGEYAAEVEKYNDMRYRWGERFFISLEAAKAAVEKSFTPVKDQTADILSYVAQYKKSDRGYYAAVAAMNRIINVLRECPE